MSRVRVAFAAFVVLGVTAAAACAPAIGDDCELSTDCSQLGDRLCDTTQPGGYCTIFNCEPDTCPDAMCVGFNFKLDPACGAADDGRWGRFERTFCMAPCDQTDDCRDGYVCLPPSARNGRIVDNEPLATQVCVPLVSIDLPTATSTATPGVCEAADAGTPWTPYDGGAP